MTKCFDVFRIKLFMDSFGIDRFLLFYFGQEPIKLEINQI